VFFAVFGPKTAVFKAIFVFLGLNTRVWDLRRWGGFSQYFRGIGGSMPSAWHVFEEFSSSNGF